MKSLANPLILADENTTYCSPQALDWPEDLVTKIFGDCDISDLYQINTNSFIPYSHNLLKKGGGSMLEKMDFPNRECSTKKLERNAYYKTLNHSIHLKIFSIPSLFL